MVSKLGSKGEKKAQQKRKKNDAKGAVILIVVLMAAVTLGVNFMQTMKTKLPQVSVIVAAENIPADTVITESMLKSDARYTTDLMKLDPQNNIAMSPSDVVGKRTCAPIYVGEAINKHRLTDNTSAMKENYGKLKEVSLVYDSNDLGLTLRKGDFVDIWKIPSSEALRNGYLPEKVLENIEIISISSDKGFDISGLDPAQMTADTYLAPGFYTVYLNEAQVAQLGSIDMKLYAPKLMAHTPNTSYEDRVKQQEALRSGVAVQPEQPSQTPEVTPSTEGTAGN